LTFIEQEGRMWVHWVGEWGYREVGMRSKNLLLEGENVNVGKGRSSERERED